MEESGNVIRQVEAYESGKVLRYDQATPNDEFGGFVEHPLDLAEFEEFRISAEEFHDRWNMR